MTENLKKLIGKDQRIVEGIWENLSETSKKWDSVGLMDRIEELLNPLVLGRFCK